MKTRFPKLQIIVIAVTSTLIAQTVFKVAWDLMFVKTSSAVYFAFLSHQSELKGIAEQDKLSFT